MGLLASVAAAGVLLSAVVLPLLIKVGVHFEHDRWSVPAGSVEGKVAIVTGANSGLGLETARVLATAGATVVMACRSTSKCEEAISSIHTSAPSAKLFAQELDLADAASVRSFSAGGWERRNFARHSRR